MKGIQQPANKPVQPFEFKGFDSPIEIFRSGTHVDSRGREITFTNGDLDEMVETFCEEERFPFCKGHPKDDHPAFGWAGGVFRKDNRLFVSESKDLDHDFKKDCEDKKYPFRSSSVTKEDGKWRVKHLAFLGAQRPAIKGLQAMFSEANGDVFEFALDESSDIEEIARSSSWGFKSMARFMRQLKNQLIADKGLEVADAQMPEYEIDVFERSGTELERLASKGAGHMYSASALQTVTQTIEDDPSMTKTPSDDGDTPVNFSQADVDALVKAAVDESTTAQQASFAQQQKCEALVTQWADSGKTLPKMEPGLAEFMVGLSTDDDLTYSFSEGDQTVDKTVSPFDFMVSLMSAMPDNFSALFKEHVTDENDPNMVVSTSEFSAPKGVSVDPESAALHKSALAFMKNNPNTTFIDAVRAVQS